MNFEGSTIWKKMEMNQQISADLVFCRPLAIGTIPADTGAAADKVDARNQREVWRGRQNWNKGLGWAATSAYPIPFSHYMCSHSFHCI